MPNRLLVIGLDGASFVALRPLAALGAIPVLARLFNDGFVAPLHSTIPPVSAPAWSTFLTGKNPGKHGVFQFYDINPGSERSLGIGERTYLAIPGVVVNTNSIRSEKLWDWVGRADRRIALINLPMAYPPVPVNGLMITGMLTPPGSKNFTYPPELASALPDYEIDLDPDEKDFSSSDTTFLRRSRQILDRRAGACLELIKRESWDLFMVVFTETDRLQHRYWHYLDPDAETLAVKLHPEVRTELRDLYSRLDRYVGELIQAAGGDCTTVILSDHGFGPAAERRLSLNVLGSMLELDPASREASRLVRHRPTKRKFYKYLGPIVPGSLLKGLEARWRQAELSRIRGKLVKLHDYIAGVWINVQRNGRGVVPPGQPYDEYRAWLASQLQVLADPVSGQRIVRWIKRREEVFSGAFVEDAPDLIFGLDDAYGIDPGGPAGLLVSDHKQRNQGTHREEGVLVMAGPGVRRGSGDRRIELQDVLPTLLHVLQIAIPDDVDGRLIEEAFDQGFRSTHSIHYQPAGSGSSLPPSDSELWSEPEEEARVRERLEQLGYLE